MNVDSSFGRSETDFVDKLGPLIILCFFLFSHLLFEEINNVLDATVKINSKNLIKMF